MVQWKPDDTAYYLHQEAVDNDIEIAMDRIANARFQANEDRKVARN
jgi:hypothetical protein